MNSKWKKLVAAFFANAVITLACVILFFEPLSQKDTISGPLVPPLINLFVYVSLSIWLFDWAARQLGNAYKAAFLIGASQFILVNVDFVLRGDRGLITAAASTLFLIITWTSLAYIYSYFSSDN